jgi:electron transfer flavoprotein alpha subunit
MHTAENDIWVLVHHRDGVIEETTFGLIGEARHLRARQSGHGMICAVALGLGLSQALEELDGWGVDSVLYMEHESLTPYNGDRQASLLSSLIRRHKPVFVLMAHTPETLDLAPRLAAILEAGVATRAMDLVIDDKGAPSVVRPIANGYLFEEVQFTCPPPFFVTFLPSVLSAPEERTGTDMEFIRDTVEGDAEAGLTRVVEVVAADPGTLDLEEADIVVSGGRGVGRDEDFAVIHELAGAIGGSVGGSRPVIDWETLPFERQIGQTGKRVAPRLIFCCGISGANEFTAGMEAAQRVVAVNMDPRARIFRFADLGVVGDVHRILPLLVERIKEEKKAEYNHEATRNSRADDPDMAGGGGGDSLHPR